ncbi:MAG TPA: flagellar filament capping protein FliD [Solirubrobacteraceae bacterium]|jgi:flagellar hook-associated protein 2
MSTSPISVNTETGSPISITGLGSGIDTSQIIEALLDAEKVPITHLTTQQEKLQGQQSVLHTLQSSLQTLSFTVADFALPSLFETSQAVSSSEPQRVAAVATAGAGVGGYQVEVTQLANSAQRTFSFTSPAAEETITVDGQEFAVKAGMSAKELAGKINASGTATVFAAAVNAETLVFSTRETGATTGEFIQVTGASLTEKAGTAKEGRDAEYSVDGVAGTSTTNVVTEAIAGVTLTFEGLTTTAGPVTVDVAAPGPSTKGIEEKIQSFVTEYNSVLEAIHKQLTTKPVAGATKPEEFETGSLFSDTELSSLVARMRSTMFDSVAGLPQEMSSPFQIGLGPGAAAGSTASKASIEGLVKLEPAKLASALAENPEAVEKMVQGWSKSLQAVLNSASAPGGTLEAKINGDEATVTQLKSRIAHMNEVLAERQQHLVAQYAKLEGILTQNNSQLGFLLQQSEHSS